MIQHIPEFAMPSSQVRQYFPNSTKHSHASKVTLKILQARLQQYTSTVNFQMFKQDLEKAEEPEIKLPTFAGSSKKEESSRKTSISAY